MLISKFESAAKCGQMVKLRYMRRHGEEVRLDEVGRWRENERRDFIVVAGANIANISSSVELKS